MSLIALVFGILVVMMGVVGIGSAIVWIVNRTSRLEGPEARARIAENEDLRQQVEALQTEVERLRERVDFTERLLEKPRDEGR